MQRKPITEIYTVKWRTPLEFPRMIVVAITLQMASQMAFQNYLYAIFNSWLTHFEDC